MAKYKLNLTAQEINTINNLRNEYVIIEQTKLNMMSVLSYLIKHGANTELGLRKSTKDIWNMYKRYHKDIKTLPTFKDIIYKLKEANLISIVRKGRVNVYFVRKFMVKPSCKPSCKPSNKKHLESVDMTSLESVSENTQIQNLKNNNITITDNTNEEPFVGNDFTKSLAYEKAIEENNKDLVEPAELIELAISKLKEQGRRSKKIIARLKTKLENRTNVVRKNVDKYLNVVIADCIAFYEVERKNMSLLIAKRKNKLSNSYNAKKNTGANFTQREYDYDKLEKQLLGWDDEDEDDAEIGTIEPTTAPSKANFTQREYDYDALEKQLLGWDDDEDDE